MSIAVGERLRVGGGVRAGDGRGDQLRFGHRRNRLGHRLAAAGDDRKILRRIAGATFGSRVVDVAVFERRGQVGVRRAILVDHVLRLLVGHPVREQLHFRAGAHGLAVLRVAVEIATRRGMRDRPVVAIAGAHAERPVAAATAIARRASGVAADDGPDARAAVIFLEFLAALDAAAEKPLENITLVVARRRNLADRAIPARPGAAVICIERRHQPGAVAARIAVTAAHLSPLAFQGRKVALHPVDAALYCVAGRTAAVARKEPATAAGALQLAARLLDLCALLFDGPVVSPALCRAAATAGQAGELRFDLPADAGLGLNVERGERHGQQKRGSRQQEPSGPRHPRRLRHVTHAAGSSLIPNTIAHPCPLDVNDA